MMRRLKTYEVDYFLKREVSVFKISNKFLSDQKNGSFDLSSIMVNIMSQEEQHLGISQSKNPRLKASVGKYGSWILIHQDDLQPEWQALGATLIKLNNSQNNKIAPIMESKNLEKKKIFSRRNEASQRKISSYRSPRQAGIKSQISISSNQLAEQHEPSLKASVVIAQLDDLEGKILS